MHQLSYDWNTQLFCCKSATYVTIPLPFMYRCMHLAFAASTTIWHYGIQIGKYICYVLSFVCAACIPMYMHTGLYAFPFSFHALSRNRIQVKSKCKMLPNVVSRQKFHWFVPTVLLDLLSILCTENGLSYSCKLCSHQPPFSAYLISIYIWCRTQLTGTGKPILSIAPLEIRAYWSRSNMKILYILTVYSYTWFLPLKIHA
jgi:hypothetical protein